MELPSFFCGRSKQLIAVEARIHIGSSFFYAVYSNPIGKYSEQRFQQRNLVDFMVKYG